MTQFRCRVFNKQYWKLTGHLHDGEANAVEADGRLERGHSLWVGQPVQAGFIHLQQQVSFLKTINVQV